MAKKKSFKISKFLKNIKALRTEINGGKPISKSILYLSRNEFVESIFDLIIKKKDTQVIWNKRQQRRRIP
jgi:hypothetical protein